MSKAPFYGVWIILNLLRQKTKVIFHLLIFGAYCWATGALQPIDKAL
jgi:hypothetical protein